MKDFHGLFSAFSLLKERKLHMHLGPNRLFIGFLKSAKFFNLIFSWSEFHICGPSAFRLLLPKAAVYEICLQTDSAFYDLHMENDKVFFS